MFLPVKKICHTFLVLTTDYKGMASATFVIIEGKHIDVHLELILIQINTAKCDWVWESVELVALKHYVSIQRRSLAMPF